MAKVVSHWPVTTEAWVYSEEIKCGIDSEQLGTWFLMSGSLTNARINSYTYC